MQYDPAPRPGGAYGMAHIPYYDEQEYDDEDFEEEEGDCDEYDYEGSDD